MPELPDIALYVDMRHIGKRIALEFEGPLVLVLHLMIAGRLRLGPPGAVRFGELMCLE